MEHSSTSHMGQWGAFVFTTPSAQDHTVIVSEKESHIICAMDYRDITCPSPKNRKQRCRRKQLKNVVSAVGGESNYNGILKMTDNFILLHQCVLWDSIDPEALILFYIYWSAFTSVALQCSPHKQMNS